MEWIQDFTLEEGEERTVETPLGSLGLRRKDGVLLYERQPLDASEPEEFVRKTFMIDHPRRPFRLSLLPVYPDRPVVFKPLDPLIIPPGENGFFCMTLTMGIGFTVKKTETLLEKVLSEPRKNSYWGPPNNGLLSYQVRSSTYTDPVDLTVTTDILTAVVPVYYRNRREAGEQVERCLVPLQELDLYRNQDGDLIFEVVNLTQHDEFYQEPEPIKRPPREMLQEVTSFMSAPAEARSLFEKVRSLPRLDTLTNIFMNR